MAVNKVLQGGTRAKLGDTVAVPAELDDALRAAGDAREAFAKLSYSHRKEYADWVGAGKKPETRIARAGKAVEMLAGGQRLR